MTYRRWASLHRWCGIILGVHWALLALSGCILVFHRDIETLMYHGAHDAQTGPQDVDVAKIYAAAEAYLPGARIAQISVQNRHSALFEVRAAPAPGEPAKILLYDRRQGRVVADSAVTGGATPLGLFIYIYRFHHMLLLGEHGETLVSISAGFLVFTLGLGVRLLWPQRRSWKRILWPRIVGRRHVRLIIVHRALGLALCVPLCVMALTGIGMIWTPALRSLAPPPQAMPASAQVSETKNTHGPVNARDALSIAADLFPAAHFVSLRMASATSPDFVVRLRQPGEIHALYGMTFLTIDQPTGHVVRISDPMKASSANSALQYFLSVHNGEVFGFISRIAILSIGAGLFVAATSAIFASVLKR